jgi:excisionase family DNA binding protein
MTAIAYNYADAAAQVGMSERTIARAVADGDLEAHYVRGTTPRILHDALIAWIESAPTARP